MILYSSGMKARIIFSISTAGTRVRIPFRKILRGSCKSRLLLKSPPLEKLFPVREEKEYRQGGALLMPLHLKGKLITSKSMMGSCLRSRGLVPSVTCFAFVLSALLLPSCRNDIIDFIEKGRGYHLSITASGGMGTVDVAASRKVYIWGTVVTLTPTPGTNYYFGGWSGADGDEVYLDGSLWKIVMDGNKTVVATFSPESTAAVSAPTITVSGSGVSRTVTISSNDSAAAIYYTLNGTTPTVSSSVYSGTITISGYYVSKTIVAIAVVSGTGSSLASETVSITPSAGSSLSITAATVSPLSLSGATTNIMGAYDLCYVNGTVYVTDNVNHRVLKVTTGGVVTVLAGTGSNGHDDGTGTSASFGEPFALATDGTNLYVADTTYNNIRRIVLSSGVVTTLAGVAGPGTYVDATGTSAGFSKPAGLWTDGTTLYVCDWVNNRIRTVNTATGRVSTLAGTGTHASTDGTGTATAAFCDPYRITSDGTNLYVTEYGGNRVRKIVLGTRGVSTVASGFTRPAGITFDGTDLYLCNADAHQIQKLTLSGSKTTIVSSGLLYPKGITTDGAVLYIADTDNGRLKKISP
jgi:sugar lactone lactonase YvrE